MERINTTLLKAYLVIGLLCGALTASAATFTAVTSGNWTSAATWGGLAPGSNISTDEIIIPSGITVYMDTDVTFNGVTTTLNVNGQLQSVANEKLVMTNGDIQGAGSITLERLEFGVLGFMSFTGDADVNKMVNINPNLLLSSVVNIADTLYLEDGSILLAGGSILELNNSSAIVVDQGSVTISGGLFTSVNPYTLIYIGMDKTVGIEANGSGLTDLYIDLDDNSQIVSLVGQVEVNGDIYQQSGDIDINGAELTINGDYSTTANAEFIGNTNSNLNIHSSGSLSSDLTFAAGGEMLNNLSISGDGSTQAKIASDMTINGELWIEQGTLSMDNSGTLIMENNTSISISNGSLDFVLGSSFDGSLTYDINYMGSSTQTGLEITGSGLNDFTVSLDDNQASLSLMNDLEVNGTLTLDNGKLDLNGNDLTLSGDFQSNNGSQISADNASNLNIEAYINDTIYFDNNDNALNDLTIDMSASGDAMIGSDVVVENLILNNGLIVLLDGDLSVNSSGSISGGNNDSYVSTEGSGSLMLDVSVSNPYVLYPVGNNDGYSPAMIQIENGTAGSFGVNVLEGVYSHGTTGTELSISEKVLDRTWNIVEGTGSSTDINLTLSWSSTMEMNGFDNTNAYITHYTSGNWDVSTADFATYDGGLDLYSMERLGISSLSPFTVKDDDSNLSMSDFGEVEISTFPNPTTDVLYLDMSQISGPVNFRITDLNGQAVEEVVTTQSENVYTIDVSDLPSGIYYILVTHNDQVTTKKVIKS